MTDDEFLMFTDDCGEWILACVVRSHRRPTGAQITEIVNAGYYRTHSLLQLAHYKAEFGQPMLTPVQKQKHLQFACEHQN